MIQHILNHFPDYMDDRTTIQIILSDDARYRHYTQVQSNEVSSWYDPSQDRAFTTSVFDEVPEDFKASLIQHTTSTGTASVMYPNLTASSNITTNDKKFSFPTKPTFNGEQFTIFWDVGQDDLALSTYDSSSPLSTLCHTYQDYGEHTIKFSSNVKSLRLENYFERIKKIESRSQVFQSLTYLYWCRNLETMKLNALSCIDTEWYDCYELTSLELPELEDIACAYSVNCMYNLKKFTAPRLKRISQATGVFKGDVRLEEINFPQLTSIYGGNGYTFMTNVSLTSAYLPKLETCLGSEFSYCVNLKKTDFSSLTTVPGSMFRDCISLKEIKLPKVKSIGASAFHRCQNLKTIDISRVKEVPTLASTNAFAGLPSDYEVLVDQALAPKMRAAQSWSAIASHIRAV